MDGCVDGCQIDRWMDGMWRDDEWISCRRVSGMVEARVERRT